MKKIKLLSVIVFVTVMYSVIFSIVLQGNEAVTVFNANTDEGVRLPVIMYHSVLKDTSRTGKYVVTPDTLKEDINYLKTHGYTFVSGEEVIDYCENGSPLPEKPVMLTFDDGHYNFYGYVMPILNEMNAKAVVSVVGSYTDEYSDSNVQNLSFGYMRWSDVFDAFLSKYTDVGNHSYDFHSKSNGRNGSQRKKGESDDSYKAAFCSDTKKAQGRFTHKTGFTPVIYTYPFGAYENETTEWLKEMGFKMSLSCTEGINIITRSPDSLFLLKRFNRPGKLRCADFFEKCGID